MSQVIQVNALSHHYNKKLALDNVSFSVDEGDFFCFLGPNGAGKSTTVKLLTGQLTPQSGKVMVFGKNVKTELQEIKYHIGVLTDDMRLPKELTVRELLEFVGRVFDYSLAQAKVACEDVLSKVELEEYADTQIGHLSSGLERRLGIGQALVNPARILFLDEPTISLDPMSSREILRLIKKLHDEGVTVFYTTHLLKEIEALCTSLAIIEHGKVVLCDSLPKLRRHAGASVEIEIINPQNNFTAANTLIRKRGWKISTVEEHTILILFPSHEAAQASLRDIVDMLQANNILYSRVGIRQSSLEDLYSEIILGER